LFIPQFKPEQPACEATIVKAQYHTLYNKINQLSWASSENRDSLNVLFDLEMMSRNTTQILEQLTRDYESSVDLHKLAEPNRSYPNNFAAHVLNTLSRLQELLPNDRKTNNSEMNSEVLLVKRNLKYFANCIAGEIFRSPSKLNFPILFRKLTDNEESGSRLYSGADRAICARMARDSRPILDDTLQM